MNMIKNIVTPLILLSVCTTLSYAQLTWNKVLTTNQRVSIIYFIDKNIGFVANGTVPGGTSQTPRLYRTSNGGTTWDKVTLSGLSSYGIQDIHFENDLVGYAIGASGSSTLWKSTDGGLTWSSRNATGLSTPLTIRKTAAGLIASDFFSQLLLSTDDGQSFKRQTTSPVYESHLGMDFVDSLHGVVDGNYRQSSTSWYYTEDGGLTWKPNGTKMETWSIFGQKGTPNFFACPEGYSTGYSTFSDVYRSTNYGQSFTTVHRFPYQMSGHVAGAGDVIYTQSSRAGASAQGVYRSTNLGTTWTHMGGYNAIADTRFFVVPDCEGNIIYIADIDGNVYRATDKIGAGGSGTKYAPCNADFTTTAPVSPGAQISVPVGIQIGNTPGVIGTKPTEVEYVIKFSTAVINKSNFNKTSDILPPGGWEYKSAVINGDSLKVVLRNTPGDAITKKQGFGSVVFTTHTSTPSTFSNIALRSVVLTEPCSKIIIEPNIEQSTLTTIPISISSVLNTKDGDQILALYPNPASKNITLRSELLTFGKKSVTILDIRGVVVMNAILPPEGSTEYQLSLDPLVPGTYTLRLDHSESVPIFKGFIIE